MKWLFALLVLANIVAYAYIRLAEPPKPVDWHGREIKADQMKLVSGAQPEAAEAPNRIDQAASMPASKPATPANGGALACYRWSGIAPNTLSRAKNRLAALKLGGDTQIQAPDGPVRFWVYIPPRPDRADAVRKAEELKGLGVEDFYVVNDNGKWQNAVSLGIYSSEEAGQRRLDDLKNRGVKSAIMRERGDGVHTATIFVRGIPAERGAELGRLPNAFKGSELAEVKC
ncbi:SPOR domain-containing protein [Chitinimonas lacunae]|uniref:SPOR domain-containing protein n=1 Tax=Chitinimonas lacunae TaxID=1963018 RepID=A0ABV8MSM8_9NEIS